MDQHGVIYVTGKGINRRASHPGRLMHCQFAGTAAAGSWAGGRVCQGFAATSPSSAGSHLLLGLGEKRYRAFCRHHELCPQAGMSPSAIQGSVGKAHGCKEEKTGRKMV